MTLHDLKSAYAVRTHEYIDAVGRMEHVAAADRVLVSDWAGALKGRVLDVGCGPGQWTHWLSGLGIAIEGLDPVPEFIARAREDYPGVRYRLGRAEQLGVASGDLGACSLGTR